MSRENDDKIVQGLQNIKEIYTKVLKLDILFHERFLLTYLKSKVDNQKIKEKIEYLLENYKYDFPHDSTLIKELNDCLTIKEKISTDSFDTIKYNYIITFSIIEKEFDTLVELTDNKKDKFILKQLKNHCESVFMRNPNMNGPNPYYKHHTNTFYDSMKINQEYLDKDFDCFIGYFKEDE